MVLDNTPNSLSVVITLNVYGCEPLLHLATTYVAGSAGFDSVGISTILGQRGVSEGCFRMSERSSCTVLLNPTLLDDV